MEIRPTIYIGYDSPHPEGYIACKNSITYHSGEIKIKPLILSDLSYLIPDKTDGSTEFTYTRFLVPYLNNFTGVAIFCDSDFIFLDSIQNLLECIDVSLPVNVVQHKDYTPKSGIKMNNKQQSHYPRKNWSSLIVWNCDHILNRQYLTPENINNTSPSSLHRFKWIDDSLIGNIDRSWNWLVGYYNETSIDQPRALHYTDGGPWLDRYKHCEYSDIWYKYYNI